MEGTVYVLRNRINNKCYVGQTLQFVHERLAQHTRCGYLLTDAIQKYGQENFELILVKYTLIDNLDNLEKELVIKYNSKQPNGYNILEFGQVGEGKYWTGRTRSEETKLKVSLNRKGKCVGKDNPFYGKRHSKELMEQIASKNRGRKWSAEQKENLSRIRKGHPVSEETRRKLSLANRGRPPAKHTLEAATLARRLKASQKYI